MARQVTQDIPSEEVERVAAGLTKAQRKFVCEPFPNEGGKIEGWDPGILSGSEGAMVERLVRLNLVWRHHYVGEGPRIRLAPLGLALRTYLERTAK